MQSAKCKVRIGGAAIVLAFVTAPLAAQTGPASDSTGSSDVALNIPGVTSADANAERLLKVIVTGVGVDQEQAKANALAKAVEQAVGLMVDAETLVRNDELLRDKVLTRTRGDIKKDVVLKEWEEDGLFHCRLQAEVVASRIAERLRKSSIDLRPVPGELFYYTAKERRRNLQNAAEMLSRQLREFSPTSFLTLTAEGEPTISEQDDNQATLKVTYSLAADLPKYMEFRGEMQELLRHMSPTRILATCHDGASSDSPFRSLEFSPEKANHIYYRVQRDGADFGYWVFLNQTFVPSSEPNVIRSQWEGYRVEKSLFEKFRPLSKTVYKVRVELLDEAGEVLATSETPLQDSGYDLVCGWTEDNPSWRREMAFLGPFLWRERNYADKPPVEEFAVVLGVAKLRQVHSSRAEIVEAPAP